MTRRLRPVPFDLEAAKRGEALVAVRTPDGRYRAGYLYADEMFVIDGRDAGRTERANVARAARKAARVNLVGRLLQEHATEAETIAALIEAGALGPEAVDPVRTIRRWQAQFKKDVSSRSRSVTSR